jgi:hypothetical protein
MRAGKLGGVLGLPLIKGGYCVHCFPNASLPDLLGAQGGVREKALPVNVVLIEPSFTEDVLYTGGEDGVVRRWALCNRADELKPGEEQRAQEGEPRVVKQRVLLPHAKIEGAQRKGWRVTGVQMRPLFDLQDFDHLDDADEEFALRKSSVSVPGGSRLASKVAKETGKC